MKNLKITNQEIFDIVEKHDQTDIEKYEQVMRIEAKAEIKTNNIVKRTKSYWKKSDWLVFANQVKSLLAD